MTDDNKEKEGYNLERRRKAALQRIRDRRPASTDIYKKDVEELVHELEIHQAELEVQNEELRRTGDALAAARNRYRDLYEYAPVGYLTLDEEGVVAQANLAAAGLCGRERGWMIGRRLEELVHEDDRDACYLLCRNAAGAGGPRSDELRLNRDDGRETWVAVEAAADRENGGGFLVTLTDITGRKKAENRLRDFGHTLEYRVALRTAESRQKSEHLRRLLAELAEADDRQRAGLADFFHDDLQQELVGARYHLETVAARQPAPDVAAPLNKAIRLLEQAVEKSRDIAASLSPPILKQQGLAAGVRALADRLAAAHGLQVDITETGPLRALPEAVTMLLYKAVRELLLNVAEHAGVAAAAVELARTDGGARATVTDAGRGFNARTVLADGTATGLGLPNLRELVAVAGGTLVIEAAPGEGTRTTVTIPLRAVDEPAPPETAPADDEQSAGEERGPRGSQQRVLLVDDHTVMREGLRMVLGAAPDIAVAGEAGDGKEALDKVEEVHPDVVLMDLSMPGMSGTEATRLIKKRHPEIRVIGLSMYTEEEGGREMLDAGAEAYFSKSGPPEKLLLAIREPGGDGETGR